MFSEFWYTGFIEYIMIIDSYNTRGRTVNLFVLSILLGSAKNIENSRIPSKHSSLSISAAVLTFILENPKYAGGGAAVGRQSHNKGGWSKIFVNRRRGGERILIFLHKQSVKGQIHLGYSLQFCDCSQRKLKNFFQFFSTTFEGVRERMFTKIFLFFFAKVSSWKFYFSKFWKLTL